MRRAGVKLVLALGVVSALGTAGRGGDGTPVGTRPAPRPSARATSAFQLFASTNLLLDANRVECNINNIGEQCVDPSNSSVIGGGFWPKGTGDGYIFNSGLQVAAILGGSRLSEPPFPWAGDTVGAFIFDARGDQYAGSPLTGVWNSRNPADLAEWPSAAYVRDPALFDASLLGERTASEQDSWVRYWDSGPREVPGRPHPMGLLVDQRTLAWNGPYANRDILYVVSRLINVSARARSRYAGLAAAGYTAADIAEIARLGARFQDSVEAKYHVDLPDTGFAWTDLYVGMGQDPDVGDAGRNYDTAILPFATAIAYKSNFLEPTWQYPSDVFFPPFAVAPGFVGTKFLLAANGAVTGGSAVTIFTNTTGGSSFPDRFGVAALWRMLAKRILPTDGFCNVTTPGSPVCLVYGTAHDTRWYMSSGPWPVVPPGESIVFAIAYVFAPAVAAAIQTDNVTPLHALGSQVFELRPGIPSIGPRLLVGADTVRQIERAAGWLTFADADGDGDLQSREVRTVPYSLLHKVAVAQAFFDNGFLTPAAPAAPRFAVLPGDGQATVVWERSSAEVTGDPYFPLASDPLSLLYDPNFRKFDVEGYRVWRGRSLGSMEVVAQFDYTGTSLTDHTGQVFGAYEQVGQCAPDMGVVTDCRADFAHGQFRAVPLAGTMVQIPPGGRIVLGDGRVLVIRADTAVTGGASGVPALRDTGVPFAFQDTGLRNGTTYVYTVTAFDVNSFNAGPTSLESEAVGKTVTPRAASSNARNAVLITALHGGDGTSLDPDAPFPAIRASDGTFTGPIPAANAGRVELAAPVQALLPQGVFSVRVDSVGPGFPDGLVPPLPPPRLYLTLLGGAESLAVAVDVAARAPGPPEAGTPYEATGAVVPYDSSQARRYGVLFGTDARMLLRFAGLAPPLAASSPGVGRAGWVGDATPASRYLAHSRWFDEGGAEPPHPTIDPFGSAAHTSGTLTGVTAIYSPLPYRLPTSGGAAQRAIASRLRYYSYATIAAWYPADLVVRWGSGGQVTVRDSTHRVNLPYKSAVQPGYGFLNAAAIVAAGVTASHLSDGSAGVTFDPAVVSYYSLGAIRPVCEGPFPMPCAALQARARLQPVDVTNDGVADGTGIALVVNGEPFYLLMDALPAPGTAWHLRAVGGGTMEATCAPALPASFADLLPGATRTACSGYRYVPPRDRPAYVPGLRYTLSVQRQSGVDSSTSGDLSRIHTVPDPFYVTAGIADGLSLVIRFVNLPERAIIRIYSQSGILVTILTHNDQTAGGEESWDVRNRGGRHVASGVYFYHVETPDHRVKIGRFTVVQQAWP